MFTDGNKRIAATLFIYFLNFYGILYKNEKQVIDNNTLTALTLLIAESNPKEKEVIIDLVMNFLKNLPIMYLYEIYLSCYFLSLQRTT